VVKLFLTRIYHYLVNLIIIENSSIGKQSFNLNQLNYHRSELREVKIKIIDSMIKNLNFNSSIKYHFMHFCLSDKIFEKKANIIKFIEENNLQKMKIESFYLNSSDGNLDLLRSSKIEIKTNRLKSLLSFFKNIFSLLNVFTSTLLRNGKFNKIYSNINQNYNLALGYTTIIRDWSRRAERIYSEVLKKDLSNVIIYINPEVQNNKISRRQMEYIKNLQVNNRSFFIYYPKFSFIRYLKAFNLGIKVVLSSRYKYVRDILLKILVQRALIDDIIRYIKVHFPNLKKFIGKEEFYSGTTYLTERLKQLGITTINLAHGVGIYSNVALYDIFYVFSKIQKDHYYLGDSKFKLYPIKNKNVVQNHKLESKKELALFFVHQWTFSNTKSKKFHYLFREVIKYQERLIEEIDIPIYAKYHPLSKEKDKILSTKMRIIESIEDLPKNYRFLTISFYSTYVLELLESQPFLLINHEGKFNIDNWFPDNPLFIVKDYKSFKDKVLELKNYDAYKEYWEDLKKLLEKEMYF
jgi:hypothetical protein